VCGSGAVTFCAFMCYVVVVSCCVVRLLLWGGRFVVLVLESCVSMLADEHSSW